MRPKIRATASRVPALVQPLPASSSIPDTAQVATPRAAAETSTRSRNLINQILLESGVTGMANLWSWGWLRDGEGVAAEEAAVGVGGGAAPDAEVVAQGGGVAEAGSVGDGVDGLVGLLEELLGQQDALPGEPALRGGPGVLHEAAGEGPLAHRCAGGRPAGGARVGPGRGRPLPPGARAGR